MTPFIIFVRSMELSKSAWMILEGLSDWGFPWPYHKSLLDGKKIHGTNSIYKWMMTRGTPPGLRKAPHIIGSSLLVMVSAFDLKSWQFLETRSFTGLLPPMKGKLYSLLGWALRILQFIIASLPPVSWHSCRTWTIHFDDLPSGKQPHNYGKSHFFNR